ncbi:MAG: hypothetical protein Q8K99_05480 [Actinomycetota bacterium]|nr:hypothetical protein [Actinomycetota bacterium]
MNERAGRMPRREGSTVTPLRLFGIAVILVVATVAWFVLAGATTYRTDTADTTGYDKVGSLWGEPQTQFAPTFRTGKKELDIASSDIAADFTLDQRKKGLLWYSTYAVDFRAT